MDSQAYDGESLEAEDVAELPPSVTDIPSRDITPSLFHFHPTARWHLVQSRSRQGAFAWRSPDVHPVQRYFAKTSHPIRGRFQAQCAHYQIANLRSRSYKVTAEVLAPPPLETDPHIAQSTAQSLEGALGLAEQLELAGPWQGCRPRACEPPAL